jgi:hypothetical protein
MNKKLRSSLVGLSALALVLAGTLYAPSQAAKKLPVRIAHQLKIDAAKQSGLSAAQRGTLSKKLKNTSHLTGFYCFVNHAEGISSDDLAKVTRSATAACTAARKLTKNLRFEGLFISDNRRFRGTNYELYIQVDSPRKVSFANVVGIDTTLPKSSKSLKFNAKYRIPAGPTTAVPGGTFVGWNTQADGLGISYQPGQKIKVKYPIQLHPMYVGFTMLLNIVSLDSESGSSYKVSYDLPTTRTEGLFTTRTSSSSQTISVSSLSGKVIVLNVPGIADRSSLTLSAGLSIQEVWYGVSPDITDGESTLFYISYDRSGTITFNHVSQF